MGSMTYVCNKQWTYVKLCKHFTKKGRLFYNAQTTYLLLFTCVSYCQADGMRNYLAVAHSCHELYAQFLHARQFMMHYRFADVAAHPTLNISAAMDATGRVGINDYTLHLLFS